MTYEEAAGILIDANSLIKDLEFLAKHEDSFRQSVILGIVHTVKAQKTIDAVEVVRCKDCIHRDPEDKKCDCSFQAMGGILPMDDDDFCSYGEKVKI